MTVPCILFDIQTALCYVHAAGNWEKAHKLLKNNPTLTDLSEELETYGKKLENTGRIKEAEKLYLALDKVDLAINMYKNCQRYDEVRMRFNLCTYSPTEGVKRKPYVFFIR